MTHDARSIAAALDRTTRDQAEASDPRASAWVSANAGTGKTHVLTTRVLRLMLAGTPPERILCLTYTKAAAAEMSKRVFDRLAQWVSMPPDALAAALTALDGSTPDEAALARARTLFASAIETPGGLKVQTIHAFCERLLQRFPLEAGVPPGFSILDEEATQRLQREAIDGMLAQATAERDTPLAAALSIAIVHAAEELFDDLLRAAMKERDWLEAAHRLEPGEDGDPLTAVEALYRRHLGVRATVTREALAADLAGVLRADELEQLAALLLTGSTNDQKCAKPIQQAMAADRHDARIDALRGFFMTAEGQPRKALMTRSLRDANMALDAIATRAQGRFVALRQELLALDTVEATMALMRLAGEALQRYQEAKARRAALDFDDLIRKTRSLLGARDAASWVLFKLDGGLDHILVDESQDTAPAQWSIVEGLAAEFFAQDAAGAARPRTLFAVGDEKQSIYSFQGAAPEMFAQKGAAFAAAAGQAGLPWKSVPLNLSFRTVAPVLQAVDDVFADPRRTPGVTAGAQPIVHVPRRYDQAGLVEVWDTIRPDDAVAVADPWQPLDEPKRTSPVMRLADRIAATIRDWLDRGEVLVSESRPIRAGDILVLVRKRFPFAGPMVAALKARGIPVAGADRIALTQHIAVRDLVALGEFLVLPEDDLALACVLKSPLFGLTDDDLLTITAGRKGSLWKAMLAHADASPAIAAACAQLKAWRSRADFTPPFEFFASILDHDGMRARLLARLGPDACDPIDEFMGLALGYDDKAPPSLAGFLVWLNETEREIKRDMEYGNDQVRVMTVHGAKGLEAPIVFLPDTCATGSAGTQGGLVPLSDMPWPAGDQHGRPMIWPVKGAKDVAAVDAACTQKDAQETAERNRLLYVAMTRARDRLYVAGFEGKRSRKPECWYDLVVGGLGPRLVPVHLPDGSTVRRFASAQAGPHDKPRHDLQQGRAAEQPPAWAAAPAPREPRLAMPLAPSRLAPYEVDAEGEPVAAAARASHVAEPGTLPPAAQTGEGRFLRGTLTHALLEHLPSVPQPAWERAARAFVERRGAGLDPAQQASIAREALAILTSPAFAPLFGPGSRAEVPIVAEVPRPPGVRPGPPLRLTGQIDRLALTAREVLIVDYKTNRPPPLRVEDVARAYLLQLAAYTLALRQIYPDREVQAALLWTDGPRIQPIPTALIERHITQLWDLDPSNLDAGGPRS